MKFTSPADLVAGSTMNGSTLTTAADLSSFSEPDLNVYASTQDDVSKVYQQVDFKRVDGTLYARSILTNPDTNGNYLTLTYQAYNSAGTTVTATKTWTLTYDATGAIITKVVA